MTSGRLLSAIATDAGLAITTPEGTDSTVLSWRWVRDHGEDPMSFDALTNQRRIDALAGPDPAPAIELAVEVVGGHEVVVLRWPDEPVVTWISCNTISALISPAETPKAPLWTGPMAAAVSIGDVDQVIEDDGALAAWLGDLATYGFARLTGFTGGHGQVEALARRIGYPRSTIFDTVWDLASDVTGHDDSAYTARFLAPHTDATYSHDAPGLQMFCCMERDGTGGESIVVDGFAIAETLRTDFPDDFAVLTSVDVPAHYIEAGVELRSARPAIRLDRHGNVVQVSMNNYDRSPMLLPPDEMAAFYRAYGRLHALANDESRWVEIALHRGDVLINDNWRVLHGRRAYTGERHFVGCYLNHEDFESRCRINGVSSGHLSS